VTTKENKKHLNELRQIHQRRLNILLQKKAAMGYETPAHIHMEIEDLKKELEKIDRTTRNLVSQGGNQVPAPFLIISIFLIFAVLLGIWLGNRNLMELLFQKNQILKSLQIIQERRGIIDEEQSNQQKVILLELQVQSYQNLRGLIKESESKEVVTSPDLPSLQSLADNEAEVRLELSKLYRDNDQVDKAQKEYSTILNDEDVSQQLKEQAQYELDSTYLP
jgi:hypothetical protein